jgi:hypothetical protein
MWSQVAPESENFNNATSPNREVGPLIGTKSTFGSVRLLGKDNKYVIKSQNVKNSDDLKIFLNELRVGAMKDIRKVGPKIHAWRIDSKTGIGYYIMDNFLMGDNTKDVVLLGQYLAEHNMGPTCLPKTHPLWEILRKKLVQFWTITKGYHGDLHAYNIALLLKKEDGSIHDAMIFDYGSHKKFKGSMKNLNCFEDYIDFVHTEFMNRIKRATVKNKGKTLKKPRTVVSSGYKIFQPKLGQPRTSNAVRLKMTHGPTRIKNSVFSRLAPNVSPKKLTQYLIKKTGKPVDDAVRHILNMYAKKTISAQSLYMNKNQFSAVIDTLKSLSKSPQKYSPVSAHTRSKVKSVAI